MDVLVIEDEAPLREFEVTYLRDAGYGTIEAQMVKLRSNCLWSINPALQSLILTCQK